MKNQIRNFSVFDWLLVVVLAAGVGYLIYHWQTPRLSEAFFMTGIAGFALNVLGKFSSVEASKDLKPFLRAATVLAFAVAAYLYSAAVLPEGKARVSEGYVLLSDHPDDGLEYSSFKSGDEIYTRQKKFIDANASLPMIDLDMDRSTREFNQDLVTLAVLQVLAERYEFKWRVGESLISERALEYARNKKVTKDVKRCAIESPALSRLRYMPSQTPAGCIYLPLGGDIAVVQQEGDWNELRITGRHVEITIRVQVFPYDNPNPPYPAWVVGSKEFSKAGMSPFYYQIYVFSRFPSRIFPLWSPYIVPEDVWRDDIHGLLERKFSDAYLLDLLRTKAMDSMLAESAAKPHAPPYILHGAGL